MGDVLPSSLRFLRAARQVYRQGAEHPPANLGGREGHSLARAVPARCVARRASRRAWPRY